MSFTELRGEAGRFRIGTRWVGPQEPCFVVAEAGSNHNGRLEQANELIDAASEAGADAVKFQLFRASRMYVRDAGVSGYLKSSTPIYDIIRAMEMPYEWLPSLAARCRAKGMEFIATPFDEEAADALEPYVDAFKVASYELTHLPLVRHVARKGKPTILSTGTGTLDEVADAVDVLRANGSGEFVLLQCTASYPAPVSTLNLKVMDTLSARFQALVGLSDHSADPIVGPLAAAARGATVIEKHFTLSRTLPGPDHPFALEPSELKLMIEKIREVQCALGSGEKTVAPVEQELHAFARRSIFTVRPIASGETFTTDNLAVLRCGERQPGLPPSRFAAIVGRKASRAIRPESALQADDVRDE